MLVFLWVFFGHFLCYCCCQFGWFCDGRAIKTEWLLDDVQRCADGALWERCVWNCDNLAFVPKESRKIPEMGINVKRMVMKRLRAIVVVKKGVIQMDLWFKYGRHSLKYITWMIYGFCKRMPFGFNKVWTKQYFFFLYKCKLFSLIVSFLLLSGTFLPNKS